MESPRRELVWQFVGGLLYLRGCLDLQVQAGERFHRGSGIDTIVTIDSIRPLTSVGGSVYFWTMFQLSF
jgi:hypothetical protein